MKFNNFEIVLDFITGMNLGIEFLNDEENKEFYTLIDLLIFRLIIIKEY